MNTTQLKAALEALLFAAGESVEEKRLASAIGQEPEETHTLLLELQERYQEEDRGIRLLQLDDSWQLGTKNEYYDALIQLEVSARKPRLTDVLLETLAIIAYKQPVTRLEIEQIRGVKSDHAVSRLIELELVREVGRLDAPGRPVLLGTSESFLRSFGLRSPGELPEMNPVRLEDMRAEAEAEVPDVKQTTRNSDEEGGILQVVVD